MTCQMTILESLCFLWSQKVSWSQMVSKLFCFNLDIDAKALPLLEKKDFCTLHLTSLQKTLAPIVTSNQPSPYCHNPKKSHLNQS